MNRIVSRHVLVLVSGGLLTTSCLDMPIEGEVAGESLRWPNAALAVSSPIVIPSANQAFDPSSQSTQLLISDRVASCAESATLATPAAGEHTLAMALQGSTPGMLTPGTYQVGGDQRNVGGASAAFLFSRSGESSRDDAVSGSIVVLEVSDEVISGQLDLSFSSGRLSGIFSTLRCASPEASAP